MKFEELDLKTAKTLDVGRYRGKPGERIPTLEEVFTAMKGHPDKLMYLDYKHIDMDRLAELVKKYKGKVLEMVDEGKQRLAYSIEKYNEGIYLFWKLEMQTDKVSEFEKELKLKKGVLRQLLIKLEN